MPSSNCCFLPEYRFLRRQVRWSVIPISWRIFHRLLWSKGVSIVNEAEVFLEWMLAIWSLVPLPFSKSSLNIWKFSVHVLLKHRLENFEHYFASMWDEWNWAAVWAFFGIASLWDWSENWSFPVLWSLLSFQILWHIECSTSIASSFRIWNSSAGIPSPPLALLVVMLPKAYLTLHSRMSALG